MLFHAKALELYTAAFQSLVSMDEEQDIEVSYFSSHLFHRYVEEKGNEHSVRK